MLTVVVMLSGPHRLSMLETALASIPIDSSAVSDVLIRAQGGPWDWAGPVRRQWESHPKVRIVEFPDYADFARSYNRTLDEVHTPWALLLPDDDYLLPATAGVALETICGNRDAQHYGFASFGWYYSKDGRYLASYFKRRDLRGLLYSSPKLVTTLLNVGRVREIGGFDGSCGGFNDTVLFTRLAFEFDALICPTPIGVYRIHAGQESAHPDRTYAPFTDALLASVGRYARTRRERRDFERGVAAYASPNGPIRPLRKLLQNATFRMRSHATPPEQHTRVRFHTWSSRT